MQKKIAAAFRHCEHSEVVPHRHCEGHEVPRGNLANQSIGLRDCHAAFRRLAMTKRILALYFAIAAVFPVLAEPIISRSVSHTAGGTDAVCVVIDEEEIQRSGAGSLTELLSLNGFYVTEGAAGSEARVTISGMTAQNIHVYVDGVLQNTSSYGRFDWGSVDLSQVERITVYRAGFCPLPYASGFNGAVIDIQTRGSGMPHTAAEVGVLSYEGAALDTKRITVTHTGSLPVEGKGSLKEVSYKAAGSLTHAKNDYCGMTNADAALANAGASVAAQTDSSRFTLDYRLCANDVNTPPQSGQEGEQTDASHAVTLGYQGKADGWAFNGGVHYQHTLTEYEEAAQWGQPSQDTHKLDTIAANFDIAAPQWGVFTARVSTRQCADILRSTASGNRARWSGFEKALVTIKPFAALPVEKSVGKENIAFDAGIGVEHYGEKAAVNPFCAVRFERDIWSIAATYARLYQEPTMYQLYWSGGSISGNRDLEAEKGNAWGLYAKCGFVPCPLFVSLVYMDTHDKIRYMDNTFKNLSRAHIFEANIRASPHSRIPVPGFGSGLLRLDLSYTFTSAKLKDTSVKGGAQDGNQIMDVPLHTFAAALTWQLGYLLTGINCEYASKRYVSNWNGEANSEYFVLGSFVSFDIPLGQGRSITPYIKASNITNRLIYSDYTRTTYRPPRAIACGMKIRT